jgi:hypothetical protein
MNALVERVLIEVDWSSASCCPSTGETKNATDEKTLGVHTKIWESRVLYLPSSRASASSRLWWRASSAPACAVDDEALRRKKRRPRAAALPAKAVGVGSRLEVGGEVVLQLMAEATSPRHGEAGVTTATAAAVAAASTTGRTGSSTRTTGTGIGRLAGVEHPPGQRDATAR